MLSRKYKGWRTGTFWNQKRKIFGNFKNRNPIENMSHGTQKGYSHFSSLKRNNTVIKNRFQNTDLFICYRWTELAVD